jgi:hypothetical protein
MLRLPANWVVPSMALSLGRDGMRHDGHRANAVLEPGQNIGSWAVLMELRPYGHL